MRFPSVYVTLPPFIMSLKLPEEYLKTKQGNTSFKKFSAFWYLPPKNIKMFILLHMHPMFIAASFSGQEMETIKVS